MACRIVGRDCKLAGESLPVQIDLTDFCERRWDAVRGTGIYRLGDYVRPNPFSRNGYEYECTQAGQVGVSEPAWPTTIAATVDDGSVVWTCRAISNNSLFKTVVSAVWSGDGFTITDEIVVNSAGEQRVSCYINGTQPAGKYRVEALVTFSGPHVESFGIEVRMEL